MNCLSMSKRHRDNAKKTKAGSSWGSLPMEIRLMILEAIPGQRNPGWASCAAVSKEWQAVIERKNFQRLTLQTSCLGDFENMVIRQRHLVQYIVLNIELPRYTCASCNQGEVRSLGDEHNSIVANAISKLFSVLKTWQPTGRLVLELNPYSLSDSEHWFKNYQFGHGLTAIKGAGDLAQQESTNSWHDPAHGWVKGQQVKPPSSLAIHRLYSPICSELPDNLPEVRAVTGFVIRRQIRRNIPPKALRALWERLPRLDTIVYEPWHIWRRSWVHSCDVELASAIQDALPSRVKTLTVFEEFNDEFASAIRREGLSYFSPMLTYHANRDLTLTRTFASKSRNLEHLSVSFKIDARPFFKSCQPSDTWDHLRSLTLTSSILVQGADPKRILALLHDASLAARNMPKLESMALWNSKNDEACAFIYQRSKGSRHATITLRGTWEIQLSQKVIKSWKEVASNLYLRIENERIQGGFSSRGDALPRLRLPAEVIDPVSLRQIGQEGMKHEYVDQRSGFSVAHISKGIASWLMAPLIWYRRRTS